MNEFARTPPEAGPVAESTHHATLDLEEPFVPAIYEAVADAMGIDPQTDEIPVREQINPDALDIVFNDESGAAFLSFPVWNARVTVHSDGAVHVRPLEDE